MNLSDNKLLSLDHGNISQQNIASFHPCLSKNNNGCPSTVHYCDKLSDSSKFRSEIKCQCTATYTQRTYMDISCSMAAQQEPREHISKEKTLNRISKKLKCAYKDLTPIIDDIINSAIVSLKSKDMKLDCTRKPSCSLSYLQYNAIARAYQLIQEVNSETKLKYEFELLPRDATSFYETDFMINSLYNIECQPPERNLSEPLFIEQKTIDHLLNLYSLLEKALYNIKKLSKKDKRGKKQPKSLKFVAEKDSVVPSLKQLGKLQSEYDNLSSTLCVLKGVMKCSECNSDQLKHKSSKCSQVALENKSSKCSQVPHQHKSSIRSQTSFKKKYTRKLFKKKSSKFECIASSGVLKHSDHETKTRITDVDGARKSILKCVAELAEARKYLKSVNSKEELDMISDIKLNKIAKECCSRQNIPHIHAKLNGIPIVLKLSQEALNTIIMSVGAQCSNQDSISAAIRTNNELKPHVIKCTGRCKSLANKREKKKTFKERWLSRNRTDVMRFQPSYYLYKNVESMQGKPRLNSSCANSFEELHKIMSDESFDSEELISNDSIKKLRNLILQKENCLKDSGSYTVCSGKSNFCKHVTEHESDVSRCSLSQVSEESIVEEEHHDTLQVNTETDDLLINSKFSNTSACNINMKDAEVTNECGYLGKTNEHATTVNSTDNIFDSSQIVLDLNATVCIENPNRSEKNKSCFNIPSMFLWDTDRVGINKKQQLGAVSHGTNSVLVNHANLNISERHEKVGTPLKTHSNNLHSSKTHIPQSCQISPKTIFKKIDTLLQAVSNGSPSNPSSDNKALHENFETNLNNIKTATISALSVPKHKKMLYRRPGFLIQTNVPLTKTVCNKNDQTNVYRTTKIPFSKDGTCLIEISVAKKNDYEIHHTSKVINPSTNDYETKESSIHIKKNNKSTKEENLTIETKSKVLVSEQNVNKEIPSVDYIYPALFSDKESVLHKIPKSLLLNDEILKLLQPPESCGDHNNLQPSCEPTFQNYKPKLAKSKTKLQCKSMDPLKASGQSKPRKSAFNNKLKRKICSCVSLTALPEGSQCRNKATIGEDTKDCTSYSTLGYLTEPSNSYNNVYEVRYVEIENNFTGVKNAEENIDLQSDEEVATVNSTVSQNPSSSSNSSHQIKHYIPTHGSKPNFNLTCVSNLLYRQKRLANERNLPGQFRKYHSDLNVSRQIVEPVADLDLKESSLSIITDISTRKDIEQMPSRCSLKSISLANDEVSNTFQKYQNIGLDPIKIPDNDTVERTCSSMCTVDNGSGFEFDEIPHKEVDDTFSSISASTYDDFQVNEHIGGPGYKKQATNIKKTHVKFMPSTQEFCSRMNEKIGHNVNTSKKKNICYVSSVKDCGNQKFTEAFSSNIPLLDHCDAQLHNSRNIGKENIIKNVYAYKQVQNLEQRNNNKCPTNVSPEVNIKHPIRTKSKWSSMFGIKISSLKNVATSTNSDQYLLEKVTKTKLKIVSSCNKCNKANRSTQCPPVTFRTNHKLDVSQQDHAMQLSEKELLFHKSSMKPLQQMTVKAHNLMGNTLNNIETKGYPKLENAMQFKTQQKQIILNNLQKPMIMKQCINEATNAVGKSKIPKLKGNRNNIHTLEKCLNTDKKKTRDVSVNNKHTDEVDVMKYVDNICQDPTEDIQTEDHFKSRLMACPSYSYISIPHQKQATSDAFSIPPDYNENELKMDCDEDILLDNRVPGICIRKRVNMECNAVNLHKVTNRTPVHIGVQLPYICPPANSCPILPNRFIINEQPSKSYELEKSNTAPMEQNYLIRQIYHSTQTSIIDQSVQNTNLSVKGLTDTQLAKSKQCGKMEKNLRFQCESSITNATSCNRKDSEELWALTKITVHHDGTREFEIIDTSPIPPGHFMIGSANSVILFGKQSCALKTNKSV